MTLNNVEKGAVEWFQRDGFPLVSHYLFGVEHKAGHRECTSAYHI